MGVLFFLTGQLESLLGADEPNALLVEQGDVERVGFGSEGVEGGTVNGLHATIVSKILYDGIAHPTSRAPPRPPSSPPPRL
jgi:hypothetical protein